MSILVKINLTIKSKPGEDKNEGKFLSLFCQIATSKNQTLNSNDRIDNRRIQQ